MPDHHVIGEHSGRNQPLFTRIRERHCGLDHVVQNQQMEVLTVSPLKSRESIGEENHCRAPGELYIYSVNWEIPQQIIRNM